MRNSRVNFLAKIPIRCWDINIKRQGITLFAAPCTSTAAAAAANIAAIRASCLSGVSVYVQYL